MAYGWAWYHSDHLGSATVIADNTGNAVRRLAYKAFGEEIVNTGTGEKPPYTYTGKELDSSGLMYYGARYDDPAFARFITPDTVSDAGTHGLNRYSYALNHPLRDTDPTGHWSITSLFGHWNWPGANLVGRRMQAEAQGAAQGAITGAVSGGVLITSMSVPGAGELLDVAVLVNPESSAWQRLAAGASLGYSLFGLGLGPNYGAINNIKQLDLVGDLSIRAARGNGLFGTVDESFTALNQTKKIEAAFQEIEQAFGKPYAQQIEQQFSSLKYQSIESNVDYGAFRLPLKGNKPPFFELNKQIGNARVMALTILHEVRHFRQYKKIGDNELWKALSNADAERFATATNIWQGKKLGLSFDEMADWLNYYREARQ